MISAEQLRAARALLRWEQAELARQSSLSVETVKRLERMEGALLSATGTTLNKLQRALESAGVEFIDQSGVRLRDRQG